MLSPAISNLISCKVYYSLLLLKVKHTVLQETWAALRPGKATATLTEAKRAVKAARKCILLFLWKFRLV